MGSLFESPLERAIREAQERKREQQLSSLGGALFKAILANSAPRPFITRPKRKVFISYHHADDIEVKGFIKRWADNEKVFIAKGLGLKFTNDIINSTNPEYVMRQIREKYLQDSSVTIVLIGSCTHSRRYVDWEIKSSLRQTSLLTPPNGLLGINLPSQGGRAHLPPRFYDNWDGKPDECYARYHSAPSSTEQLRNWIEDAYKARTSRARFIKNSSDMMKKNTQCKVCNRTH